MLMRWLRRGCTSSVHQCGADRPRSPPRHRHVTRVRVDAAGAVGRQRAREEDQRRAQRGPAGRGSTGVPVDPALLSTRGHALRWTNQSRPLRLCLSMVRGPGWATHAEPHGTGRGRPKADAVVRRCLTCRTAHRRCSGPTPAGRQKDQWKWRRCAGAGGSEGRDRCSPGVVCQMCAGGGWRGRTCICWKGGLEDGSQQEWWLGRCGCRSRRGDR